MATFSIIITVLAETRPGLPGCTVLVCKTGLILLGLARAGLGRGPALNYCDIRVNKSIYI